MPVAYYNTTTGSQTSTAGSGTLTLTLPTSAPSAGQWVFVAFIGNDPANVKPSAAKCGTVNLDVVDAGYVLTGSRVPVLFGAQMPASGMTTSITITWTNTAGVSRSMYAVALVIGGAVTTGYSQFSVHTKQYFYQGLYDGSSNGLDVGGLASNGVTQATGSILSWSASAGIKTTYDTQKQPFVLATWNGTGSAGYSSPATINGATTIINGQPTTSGKSAGTITLTSTVGYTVTPVYLLTNNGVCPINYTGVSGNDLVNCSVYGGSASGFYNYATNLNAAGVSINHPVLIQTSSATAAQPLNGWQMGVNATTGKGNSIGTAGVTGVQAQGQLTLSFGQSNGLTQTPAYLVTSGASNACGSVLVTLIPSTRTMTRPMYTSLVNMSNQLRTRVSKVVSSLVSAASVSRLLFRRRNIYATATSTPRLTKTKTARVFASLVSPAKVLRTINKTRTVYATRVANARIARNIARNERVTGVGAALQTRQRGLKRVLSVSTVSGGVIGRAVTKAVSGVSVAVGSVRRSRKYNRKVVATGSVTATVTKSRNYNKRLTVTTVYVVGTSRSRTFVRKVVAGLVATARAVGKIVFVPHAGQVSVGYVVSSVKGGFNQPTLTVGWETASVVTSKTTGSTAVGWQAPTVKTNFGVKNKP